MPHPKQKLKETNHVSFMILLGIFVHVLLLCAVMDIYFSSPIDNGMKPVKSTDNPPAKRVVIIVADGLRADAIYGKDKEEHVPFLSKKRWYRASWGIAHTRVPTESRPGHVALLGGIYEDPSAIFIGWSGNPVKFDSVINQSTNAWCWGSPNVVNMFNKDNSSHIHAYTYSDELQDFGKKNTNVLDEWVLEKVDIFLKEAVPYENHTELYQSGNIFFLHLLGTDTAGHGFKPESKEYEDNVRNVDKIVKKVEHIFESAFPDGKTAYVFTADHGMTDWGSHGAGSPEETEVPIIAWGAGVKINYYQNDIKQVDVAPLISALIGINYPVNSVGTLPMSYIGLPREQAARMMMNNLMQHMEIYKVKERKIAKNAFRFVPFLSVSPLMIQSKLLQLEVLIEQQVWNVFVKNSKEAISFFDTGSDYYHNYYQLPLLIAVTIGLVSWIIFVATYNIPIRRSYTKQKFLKFLHFYCFAPIYVNICVIIYYQKLQVSYYVYFLFPAVMTQSLVMRYKYVMEGLKLLKNYGLGATAFSAFIYSYGLYMLVYSFSEREACSTSLIIVGLSVFVSKSLREHTDRTEKFTWLFVCILLSGFPIMPAMKTTFNPFTYFCGYSVWWMVLDRMHLLQTYRRLYNQERVKAIGLQQLVAKLTPLYSLAIELHVISPGSYLKLIGWGLALYPILLIPISHTYVFTRITSIFVGFVPFYMIVGMNFELLFLVAYVMLIYLWILLESKCCGCKSLYSIDYDQPYAPIARQTADDFRRAFFFICMLFLGYFGPGHFASINSFDPNWVRGFVTVFSPFTMMTLIVAKFAVPFIYIVAAFRAMTIFQKGSALGTFCVVLVFLGVMTMQLLYSIKNIGSWLEIGTSLSHFILMEAFVLILLVLYGLVKFLTTFTFKHEGDAAIS